MDVFKEGKKQRTVRKGKEIPKGRLQQSNGIAQSV
jgi:hypothetical protein